MDVSEEVNKVPTPSYADIDIRDVTEDANVVSPRLYRTDAIESTFKEQTPIPDAPLPKLSKMTNMLMSRANPDCEVPVASTTDEEGEEAVNPNVSNPKPLSPIIEQSECGTPAVGNVQPLSPSVEKNMVETSSLEDPNPSIVVEKVSVP
ncbi:hypothetical protein Bca52824_054106 [Brassica carinata]|uniref:Uncharacterized protein n=1 Tax=Brassica carinata TaxID=52824 RepID=A0A8X7UME1_BRACI|nr:hypothetical protein Bca52824_054106 [Brassica carinata]